MLAGVGVRDALDSAVTALRAARVDTPRLDAEVLLAHVLEVDRSALVLEGERPVEGRAVRAFQDAVRRRAIEREPVAYITSSRGFRRLQLRCDQRALIPRPETELLVEAALELPHGIRVQDVATGGGAVALALKDERPDLRVSGSDISVQALELARENARALALDVAFLHADLLAGCDAAEAIVCNPPYIQEGAPLQPEITRHEPPQALYGGPDGLALIRRLIAQCAARQVPWLALEVGLGQAQATAALALQAGFGTVCVRRDLAGIERVVVAQR